MSRGGFIAVAAMFLIAAAPIPALQPIHHRPEHAVEHPTDAGSEYGYSDELLPPITVAPIYPENSANDLATDPSDQPAKHDDESSVKWTDIAIVILTGGLVIAAALQFIAALLQWNAMNRQEGQMRRSVIEARRASNRQSRDTLAAIKASEESSAKQSADMQASIAAAQKAADAAVAAQRPWIKVVDLKIENTNTSSGTQNSQIRLEISLKNTGNSPAINIRINTKIFPERVPRRVGDYVMADAKRDVMSEAMVGQSEGSLGLMLFPNDETSISQIKGISWDRFKAHAATSSDGKSLYICIAGCVTYRFVGGIGHTEFCAMISDGDDRNWKPLDTSQPALPQKGFVMSRSSFEESAS